MLTRALLVLLVVLNAGVGLWWMLRPVPAAPVAPMADKAAPQLVLLRELAPPAARDAGPARLAGADAAAAAATGAAPAGAVVATVAGAAPAGAVVATVAGAAPGGAVVAAAAPDDAAIPAAAASASQPSPPARCFSVGPFTDPALLARVAARLRSSASATRVRTAAPPAARGWQVVIAPAADRQAAQQVAAAIGAAGFDDYFVVPDSNAIALGRYGAEASARGREAALRAKGFAAIAEPIGAGPPRSWLDIKVADVAVDRARLAREAEGAGLQSSACAGSPATPTAAVASPPPARLPAAAR